METVIFCFKYYLYLIFILSICNLDLHNYRSTIRPNKFPASHQNFYKKKMRVFLERFTSYRILKISMCGRVKYHCNLKQQFLYGFLLNMHMIILCRKKFHQTSVENCIITLVLLFICKKKEKKNNWRYVFLPCGRWWETENLFYLALFTSPPLPPASFSIAYSCFLLMKIKKYILH